MITWLHRFPVRYLLAGLSVLGVGLVAFGPLGAGRRSLLETNGFETVAYVGAIVLIVGWLPVVFRKVGAVITAVVLTVPMAAVFTLLPLLAMPFTVLAWLTAVSAWTDPRLVRQPPPPRLPN